MSVLPLVTALTCVALAALCAALVCGAAHLARTTPTREKEPQS